MLADLGAAVIDADALSRASTAAGGAAIPAILEAFGAQALDPSGAMNRAFIRELAFADPAAKAKLEAIIHPIVRSQAELALAEAAAKGQWVVQDVPLLVESGRWRGALSAVLVIDCEEATQMARVQARSGLTAAQVRGIMASQASRAQRLAAADHVIYNEGLSLQALATEVQQLVSALGFHQDAARQGL